jgi:hypothetical protein
MFGAENTKPQPSQEEKEYLIKRSRLESDMRFLMKIDRYEYYYDLFCEYGLEEKMLKKVEGHIQYLSRFEPNELLKSTFYKRFKDKELAKEYIEHI